MSPTLSKHLGLAVATGSILALGCPFTETNTQHCYNNDGDAYCAAQYPDGSRPYCESGVGACLSEGSGVHGCLAERPADECYSPCGGRETVLDNGACLMMEDSSSGSSSGGTETEGSIGSESSTTGPMPCVGNEDCPDTAAPFCEPGSGECVACDAFGAEGDAACAGLDPVAPLCVNGTCVACTPENPVVCDDQLLLCDGGTNTCIQCTEHAQCGSGACELAVGTCFPGDFVVTVDGDGPADYPSIAAAVAAVDDGTHGVIVVHELDGAGSYQTAGMGLRINGGKTIALVAAPGEAPIILGTNSNPGLRVEAAGTIVYMDGLSLVGNTTGLGLDVDGAFAWVDRSRIVNNTGGGIVAQTGAELVLRNGFVGGSNNNVSAMRVDAASAELVYTTLTSGFLAATALSCNAPTDVSVRNSILLVGAATDAVACPEATIANSATEDLVGAFDGSQDWFTDYVGADLSLTPSGALIFADIAQWQTGDPSTDIDGQPRPIVDGTADYAGADVP